MDLQKYLDEIVGPTIAELEANPTSRRHAFLACVATFHAIDVLAHSDLTPDRRNLREQVRKVSPEFAIVDRVAHAFKHVAAGHPNAPRNQPLASMDVIPRPPGFSDLGFLDISCTDDLLGGVTLNQERGVDLLSTVKKATQFMELTYLPPKLPKPSS